jgi:AraC-like DNA-binding protein
LDRSNRHLELFALRTLDPRQRDQHARALADPTWGESLWQAFLCENGNERLISSLSRALEAVDLQDERYSADDLRLAIAIRLLDLKSGAVGPANSGGVPPNRREIRELQKWRLKRVIEYVDARLATRITLADMAAVAGLSRMHFASQFRMATGLRPHQFLLRRRVQRAEGLLQNTTMSIVEIALTVGFQTQAHLTTVFKRFMGCTPGRWRALNRASLASPRSEEMESRRSSVARSSSSPDLVSVRSPGPTYFQSRTGVAETNDVKQGICEYCPGVASFCEEYHRSDDSRSAKGARR